MRNLFILFAALLVVLHSSSAATPQPNIVLVMADDQGWGDTGYNGHPELKTPNLDSMAASGLRLNRFYTAHFNCSPTRASVMTGRHPHRMGTFGPGSPIRAQEVTVAKVLQSAGYATGHFGKWHLNGKNGDRNTKTPPGRAILVDDPLSPGKLGFDEWVSADNFFDLDPVLGRDGVAEKFEGDGSDISMDEALKFIRKQSDAGKPFLAVVWFGNPHTPHEALPADKALYSSLPEKDQHYYGELTGIDRNVGKLRAALRELKVSDNTLVWYCSDNGGANGPKSTGNLRGSKGTLWEGGVRVPGIVEWPARVAKPFACDVPCSTLDIYPTLLAATNAAASKQVQPIDGVNLLPLFDQQMSARDKAIPFWADARRPTAHATLIDWPYKLHTHASERKNKQNRNNDPTSPTLLYDLSKDPNETTNLASQQPERVAQMTTVLETWKASVTKSLAGEDYEVPLKESTPVTKKPKRTKKTQTKS
jgi:arylsulfatase A-like enzyme